MPTLVEIGLEPIEDDNSLVEFKGLEPLNETSFDPIKEAASAPKDTLHRVMGGLTTGALGSVEGIARWGQLITDAQNTVLDRVGLGAPSAAVSKGLGKVADVFGELKQDVQTYSESKRNRERDPLFSAQLAEAGGNFAGQIATTAASKVAGLVNNVGQMFQQEYGAAKEKGADDLTAYQAGVYNLPAAFLDYFTESKMVKSLIPQQAKRTIAEVTKKIFTNAGLEGATEVIQDEYSNWLAGNALKYDQERAVENRFSKDNLPETGKQIAKTFAIGGILGGAATTAFEALQPAKIDEKGLAKEERLEALQKELDQINETQEKTQTSTAEFTPTISTTIPEVAGNAPSTAQSEITRISPEVRQLALDTEAEKSLTEAEQLLNEPEIAQDTVTPEQGTLSLEKEPITQPEAITGIPSESDLKKIDVLKKATDVLKEDWESAPQIEVVADVSAIPDTALTPAEKDAIKGNVSPDGLFGKDGKVYIIGDKVPNIQRVKELVLHETKAHYGFKSLFGGDDVAYKRAMQTALDEFNARPKMADALAARRGGFKDLADLVKAYDHLNVEHKEGKYAITEELLSRAAELYHDPTKARPTWFNRIISRIKLALQPIMPGMKLNDQDIINLLGTKSTELLDAASKKVETGDADIPKFSLVADKKPAPAVYYKDQTFEGDPNIADFSFPYFNLTEDIPGHVKNSTVSADTLIDLGYGPPEGYTGKFEKTVWPKFSLVKKQTLRSFSERQKDNAQFEQIGMADLVEKIDSNYQAVSNKEGAQEATKTLSEIGIAEAMDRVDSSETISARERQYLGIAAMEYWNNVAAKAETQEDLDIASRNMVHVIESLARRGTEYGQAIQAMRGRLTPEGWIRTTLNQFKEAQAPMRKAGKEVVDELKKEVGSKEKQIKEVVEKKPRIKKLVEDLEKKSSERKKSEPKEKKPKKEKFHDSSIPLWDQLKRAGQKSIQDKLSGKTKESQQGAINSFASDILKRISKQIPVKESLAKLSPEQKLKSLFQNWDKYKDYITNAYNDMVSSQSYEKLLDINTWMMEANNKFPFLEKELKNLVLDGIKQAGSPTKVTEVANSLADRLGMAKEQKENFIQLANEFAYPLIEKASTESAQKEIRSLKDIIFESAKSKQLTVESLSKRLVDESGLTGKEAEALSKAVISAANAQIGHQAASYINRLKKTNSADKKIVKAMKDDITKIMDYSISGVLDDETLYNHLAEKLNLPFYDQKFIQEVKKDAERIKDDGLLNKSPMLKNKAIYDLGNKIAKRTGTSNYDIAQAYWYASVLSGIRTQLKNFVGTAGQSQLNNFLLSADALRRGDKGEVMAIYSGWLGGLEKGVAAASDALLKGDFTGQYSFEAKKAASALEQISDSPDKWKRIISNAKYVSRLMAAADILNASANAESRARLKAYQLTKDVNLSNQDRQKAINEILHTTPNEIKEAQLQAEQEGFKPESTTYRRRVNEILELQRPSDLNSEAREYGLLSTYNNEPNTNTLLGALAGFIEKGIASGNKSKSDVVKLSARATRFLIPFTRIVANVGNEQLNYTPVGLLRLATLKNFNKDIETTQTDLTLLKAKILLGNGMLMGLAAMLSQWDDEDDPPFQIVGSGPSDYTKRSQWLAAGNKPWSIIWKDKKGKKHTATYTYSPFAMMLGVLGAYKDAQRYGNIDEKSAITKVASAIANGLTVITDASFLSSVTSLMDVYAKRKETESFSKGLVHQVARTAGGLAPNILKEFDSWFNKPLRDTKPSSFEFAAIFANQLPVIKDAVGKPMLNVLGEEIKNPKYPWQPFVESKEVDPIWTVLAKKQNDGVFISLPDAATKILPDGKRQTMTNKELYEYRKQYGQELKKTLIENMSLFEKADPETSKKLLEGWSAAARATAKLNLNFF